MTGFYCREGVYQTHMRTPKNTPQNQPHHHRLPPWSIFVGFCNPKWQNRSKRVDRLIWWLGFIAGRGFIKINHIIIGFPLGQYFSDFEIRSSKIDLDGLINEFADRAANVGGQFYCREGVCQTRACTPKNTPQNQPHYQRLPTWSIFVGFWNPKWQNRS